MEHITGEQKHEYTELVKHCSDLLEVYPRVRHITDLVILRENKVDKLINTSKVDNTLFHTYVQLP